MSFAKDHRDIHVRLEVDNTTTVSYLNKQGGRISHLYHLALQTWQFAIERGIWISAAHLPGVLNVEADAASRNAYAYDKEWQLSPEVFRNIQAELGNNEVDMFASRLNAQLPNYVSWHPDPGAMAIDAFSLDWSLYNSFFFPPFSVVGRTVQKIAADRATGTLVAPIWPTQAWYSTLLRLTDGTPRILTHPQLLQLPHKPDLQHPLQKLKLAAFRISAKHSTHKGSHLVQERSFWHLGAGGRQNSTACTQISG